MFTLGVHIVEVIQLPKTIDSFELFVVNVLCNVVKALTAAPDVRCIQSSTDAEPLFFTFGRVFDLDGSSYIVTFVENEYFAKRWKD